MKVLIKKATLKSYWYNDYIGEIIEVDVDSKNRALNFVSAQIDFLKAH